MRLECAYRIVSYPPSQSLYDRNTHTRIDSEIRVRRKTTLLLKTHLHSSQVNLQPNMTSQPQKPHHPKFPCFDAL
ncbi:hypothetical protein BDR05DRAFT_961489 [Suillus weaverae]|nr:hypothetical protein BDR05DRAFT_961489 [Suillus weaverae]